MKFVPVTESQVLKRIPTSTMFTTRYTPGTTVKDYKREISEHHFGFDLDKI
jgi:hypothetical protein